MGPLMVDKWAHLVIENTVIVSSKLEPEGDEEIFVLSDDIPFRS
jgi:hypothetical protein